MGRTVFPVCASFGPTFMALGHVVPHREGFPVGLLIALPGAIMLTIALNILYREVTARDRTVDHPAN
jgi:hypothetical protein